MKKLYLSDAGPKVSGAIYGFWRWEAGDLAQTERMDSVVKLCLDQGINTFDHADRYGDYLAEAAFGAAIKRMGISRSSLVLFSKAGVNLPHPSRPAFRVRHYDSSQAHVQASVEASLKALGTDYLDVFLLDHLDPLADLEATALGLEKLHASGKIRSIGIANFSVYQHQLLAAYLNVPIVSNHIDLSLLDTQALDNGVLDYCKQKFMRPLALSPLAGGRIEHGTDESAIRLRKKLLEMADQYNSNLESIAVAWILKLGALPLIGTLESSRIRNIVAAFDLDLQAQDWYDLYHSAKWNMDWKD